MTDNKEALKKQIADLSGKISKITPSNKDANLRSLRKQLKRAQRRLALLTPVSLDDKLKKTTKQQELIGKILSEMTKAMKKVQGNPYVHSLRKKTKSLNKRVKKINRLLEKKKRDAPAAPAQPPQSAP